jgi:hypothetical protein
MTNSIKFYIEHNANIRGGGVIGQCEKHYFGIRANQSYMGRLALGK